MDQNFTSIQALDCFQSFDPLRPALPQGNMLHCLFAIVSGVEKLQIAPKMFMGRVS